jgi:hypothetical protein
MSRTDAHRPAFVWVNDHPELAREHHDHINGVCELTLDEPHRQFGRGCCYVDLDWTVRLCSCAMCSGRPWRRANLRRRRAAERTLTGLAVRGASQEELEEAEGAVLRLGRIW